jgi:hypothetical protein
MDTLHNHHPTSRLYYTIPWYQFEKVWRRHSYRRSRNTLHEERLPEWQVAQRVRDEAEANIFKPIVGSPVLYSLNAVSKGNMQSGLMMTKFVGWILKTCSNLRELDFKVDSWGRSRPNDPVAFDFTGPNITLPSLEVLKLYNYEFSAKPSGRKWEELGAEKPSERALNFPWNQLPSSFASWIGFPKKRSSGGIDAQKALSDSELKKDVRTNLGVWLDIMGWTHLHTLKLEHFNLDIIPKFQGPVLPGLKNLELWFGRPSCSFDSSLFLNFLLESAPLESLTLTGIKLDSTEPLDSIIAILGQRHAKLRALRLSVVKSSSYKSNESLTLLDRSPFLNTSLLRRLYRSCPDIHTLDINVDTQQEWDYDLLDYLASILGLRHLTLRFEEPEKCEYNKGEQVNEKERVLMEGLTLYLRKKKNGDLLETLGIFVGDREVVSAGGKWQGSDDGDVDYSGDYSQDLRYDGLGGYAGPDDYDESYEDEEEEELVALQRELAM